MAGRFSRFTVISGIGWLLDFGVMLCLVNLGWPLFLANLAGASCGVTFVFFAAARHVFRRVTHWRLPTLVGLYWTWQVMAILAASAAIAEIGALLVPWAAAAGLPARPASGLAAKVLVTPLTLMANFFFMQWLLERSGRQVT